MDDQSGEPPIIVEETNTNIDTIQSDDPMESETGGPRSELLNKQRQFVLLDEVNEEDDTAEGPGSGSDNSDMSDDELYNMLDEQLEKSKQPSNDDYDEKDKIILVEKIQNHFEVLPDGWIKTNHRSGMPIYLNRANRVCTFSKPYFIGGGSVRRHDIPVSSIPCLEYRRAIEKTDSDNKTTITVNGTELPNATVETAQENEEKSLNAEQVREYCQKLFEFKTIRVTRFKSWPARRRYAKQQKNKTQRPTLPKDTRLISFSNEDGRIGGKDWIMNPNGKSYVCILHAYVQRVLKQQPMYEFKEVENAATPYSATIKINGMQYGIGFGSSKKIAKMEAAKATLETLIPEMKEKINQDSRESGRASNSKETDLSFFDGIKITDPRVAELCEKTTEPSPHAVLLTCLQRNFSLNENHIKYETKTLNHSKNEFTLTVGPHQVTVICINKRDGKQKASQAILQKLHPHITSWGSLLRLYGNQSAKAIKAKKLEEQEITLLQCCAAAHSPNYAILNKLKEEMGKIKAKRDAIKPIGIFVPPDNVDLPSSSIPDFNNVQL